MSCPDVLPSYHFIPHPTWRTSSWPMVLDATVPSHKRKREEPSCDSSDDDTLSFEAELPPQETLAELVAKFESRLHQSLAEVRVSIQYENAFATNIQSSLRSLSSDPFAFFPYTSTCGPQHEKGEETIFGHKVGWFGIKGTVRPQMEDATLAQSFVFHLAGKVHQAVLLAVFDGHGGELASHFCRDNLSHTLFEQLEVFNKDAITLHGIHNALSRTPQALDKRFRALHPKETTGTTATICLIWGQQLWVINVGDSRAIMVGNAKTMTLTADAKPTHPRYRNEIMERGGVVIRGRAGPIHGGIPKPILAIGRAIGNGNYMCNEDGVRCITSLPTITAYKIDKTRPATLVIACDGLWDTASSDCVGDAVRTASGISACELAEWLTAGAFRRGSTDNISTLVARLII